MLHRHCSSPLRSILFVIQRFAVAGLFGVALAQPAFATPAPKTDITSYPALKPASSNIFDEFRVAEKVQISQLNKVFVEKAVIEYNPKWLKNNRRDLDERYLTSTSDRYAYILNQELSDALTKSEHFTVVDNAAEATLILSPRLTQLSINGPDVDMNVDHYVDNAGAASFQASLTTPSGAPVALLSDHDDTRKRGFLHPQKTSRVTNQRDFRFLFEKWSKHLVEHMEQN